MLRMKIMSASFDLIVFSFQYQSHPAIFQTIGGLVGSVPETQQSFRWMAVKERARSYLGDVLLLQAQKPDVEKNPICWCE